MEPQMGGFFIEFMDSLYGGTQVLIYSLIKMEKSWNLEIRT